MLCPEYEEFVRLPRHCPILGKQLRRFLTTGITTVQRASLTAVSGVTLKGGETLGADLVVDTSGRGSKVASWLQAGGYEAPRSVEVNPNVAYYSTVNEAPQEVCALALTHD